MKRNTFFSADQHIGHENSIKFDERPFKDLDHMHESLVKRHNATVGPDDTVYYLGDIGTNTAMIKDVVGRMNGTKIFVMGNHDKSPTTMLNCGFDVVVYAATLFIAGERVTMTHCPLRGLFREDTSGMHGTDAINQPNWHGEGRKKHKMCSIENEGQFHLHGHIHSRKNRTISKKILGRQYDVGVPANNYTPVSISQIESWIALTKRSEDGTS